MDRKILSELGYKIYAGHGGCSTYFKDELVFTGNLYLYPKDDNDLQSVSNMARFNDLAWREAQHHCTYQKTWLPLWEALGEVPLAEDEEGALITDGEFLDFPVGFDLHVIWLWFENTFDCRVGELMSGETTTNP